MTTTPPLDLTKPMQTRDGRPALLVANRVTGSCPLAFVITNEDGTHHIFYAYPGGSYYPYGSGPQSPHDILNIPTAPTVTPWTAATMPWPCWVQLKGWGDDWAMVTGANSQGPKVAWAGYQPTWKQFLEDWLHVKPNGETGVCGVES